MSFKRGWADGRYFSYFSFIFIVIVIFFSLAFRLFQLTIVKGEYYHRLSEENRIKQILIEPQRGRLLDRNGATLAENTKPNPNEDAQRLFSKRVYHDAEAVAPFIGYRQPADQNDLNNDLCLNKAQSGDTVGKKGVEKLYDCDLRGRVGKKLVELDAHGKYQKTLNVLPPADGKNLQLALDLGLQKKAAELLSSLEVGKKGAIIAIKPSTGEILALYSSPSYNPQDFENNNQTKIKEYLTSPDHPLFNRATEGTYPPGSIFKLFVATGALEDKKLDENTELVDNGTIKAGPLTFGNWYFLQYGKTEGSLNIVKAIRRSTDTFFYQAGEKLGPERMKYWADRLGLGKKIDLNLDQSEGTLPSPYWKIETLKDQWYTGDTYNMSIGQGYILVTPLQIAQATATFANNGELCKPGLLKDEIRGCNNLHISQKTINLVREGMRQACSPGGTGYPLFNFSVTNKAAEKNATTSAQIQIQTACKTGTAEAVSGDSKSPHAWITVFAPFENPEIALTVLVENGGQGSDVAGPIARDLLKTYFEENH